MPDGLTPAAVGNTQSPKALDLKTLDSDRPQLLTPQCHPCKSSTPPPPRKPLSAHNPPGVCLVGWGPKTRVCARRDNEHGRAPAWGARSRHSPRVSHVVPRWWRASVRRASRNRSCGARCARITFAQRTPYIKLTTRLSKRPHPAPRTSVPTLSLSGSSSATLSEAVSGADPHPVTANTCCPHGEGVLTPIPHAVHPQVEMAGRRNAHTPPDGWLGAA